VPLTDTADGWIATHLTQIIEIMRQKQRPGAHARRCQGGFRTGMSTTNDNDVITQFKSHRLNPAQKLRSCILTKFSTFRYTQLLRPSHLV
jgi:hypothetical protein